MVVIVTSGIEDGGGATVVGAVSDETGAGAGSDGAGGALVGGAGAGGAGAGGAGAGGALVVAGGAGAGGGLEDDAAAPAKKSVTISIGSTAKLSNDRVGLVLGNAAGGDRARAQCASISAETGNVGSGTAGLGSTAK